MSHPHPAFPIDFAPLTGSARDCESCGQGERVGFEFDFAYQPIIDVVSGEVFAHEALVRGPEGQSAASVLAQVNDQNRYRFDQSCRVKALKGASELGLRERLSINFLPNAIYRPELCIRTTLAAAAKYGFPVQQIIFEVTEGERVQDANWLTAILHEYKRCGFLTAIDDFGAGFAGLGLLADFQPDLIKLDMGLIRDIEQRPARQAIVRHLVRLCADLGIQVIAEGVETRLERDFLAEAGIRLMQGYLFARPQFRGVAAIDAAALRPPPG